MLGFGALTAVLVLLLTRFKYLFGATLDWSDQHFAIPDYFRKLYYETGELFPSFAPNLGGGENIYYLSYYGLCSPVILLSYLMPFVSMAVYIQVSSAVLCWLSTALLYRFMRKRHSRLRSALLALAYLTATPIFFHAHRHIMFVSMMPFVILAFEAVDKFFEGRGKWQLVLWTFFVIMCNWFFAVSAVAAITVYGIYRYLSLCGQFRAGDFFKAAGSFALRIINAVMLSGVLLLPTVNVLMSGRDKSNSGITLTDLIPQVSTEVMGYSPYSMGLGVFAVLAVICAVSAKGDKARRFLGGVFAVISCFPVFMYALNGTMYLEAKVFIPFIPLALILCGDLFDDLDKRRLPIPSAGLCAIVIGLSTAFAQMHMTPDYQRIAKLGIVIDAGILAVVLILHYAKGYRVPFYFSMLLLPVILLVPVNQRDALVTAENLDKWTSPAYTALSREAYTRSDSLWRCAAADNRDDTVNMVYDTTYYSSYIYSSLHHKGYNDFYFKVMNNENEYRNSALTTRSQNPFFTAFMGERYLISRSGTAPYGYVHEAQSEDLFLYENPSAFPIGRTGETLGEDVFDSLNSAEKMEALTKYIVTGTGGSFEGTVTEAGTVDLPEDSRIRREGSGWRITSGEKFTASAALPFEVPEGKLLVLETVCDNTVGERIDARVTINGIRNALTAPDWKYYNNNTLFTYVLTPCESLEFIFTAGDFALTELKAWLVDAPQYTGDALIIDKAATKGDVMEGTVYCEEDTYFELAVPYDKGFTITVDGRGYLYECVDKAFIGLPLKAGEHKIRVEYKAPLLKEGKLMSAAGALLFILLIILDILNKRRKENGALQH